MKNVVTYDVLIPEIVAMLLEELNDQVGELAEAPAFQPDNTNTVFTCCDVRDEVLVRHAAAHGLTTHEDGVLPWAADAGHG